MSENATTALEAFAREIAGYTRPTAPHALRTQLRASLRAASTAQSSRPPIAGGRLPTLGPILAGLLLLALMAGAGGFAAASSLPGDTGFALKRAVEEMQVAIAPGDAARLNTLVTQADRRLSDLEFITATRPGMLVIAMSEYEDAVNRVDAALTSALAQAPASERDDAIARAAASSTGHIAALQSLVERLPTPARPAVQHAIETQQEVHGKSDVPGRDENPGRQAPGASGAPGRK